jgi:branched-chain amino acid transport system substrate-binding protein
MPDAADEPACTVQEEMLTGARGLTALLRRCLPVPLAAFACLLLLAPLRADEPIKIGFSMALSGPLAAAGQSALIAMKIWEDDVNKRGGLLGRKVRLVFYDDKSNPLEVATIYTKLIDVDGVDLIMGPYATMQIAPALSVAIPRKKLLIGLLGNGVNEGPKYGRYFSMSPAGSQPKTALTKGFFEVAAAQIPRPQTLALAAVDSEFGRKVQDGARENARAAGLRVVYDRNYAPATTDFAPIVQAVQAANPELVVICSYTLDSVGWVRAVNDTGFKPKMIGGGMAGLQATAIKQQLGPLLNGFVNYEAWLPARTMKFPGALDLVERYQERAKAERVDPLGYQLPPWAYAYLQVLEQAIAVTKSLDDGKLADYLHQHPVKTVVGEVNFGADGEWTEPRLLQVQYRNIKSSNVREFTHMDKQAILAPAGLKTGELIYPFAEAKTK